jgi:hypothetical protein
MLISIIGSSGTHGKVALGICVHTGQLVRRLGMSQGGVAMQWAEMPADLQLPWDANISEVLLMALSAPKDQKASLRYEQTHLVQTCGVELCQLQPGDKGSSERRDLAVGTSVSGGPHLLQDDARLIEYRQGGIGPESNIEEFLVTSVKYQRAKTIVTRERLSWRHRVILAAWKMVGVLGAGISFGCSGVSHDE